LRLFWEECETTYATDRSVECYERLKSKHPSAAFVQPLSTGAVYAITEKAAETSRGDGSRGPAGRSTGERPGDGVVTDP